VVVYGFALLIVAGAAGITADEEWDSEGVLGVAVIAVLNALLYLAARSLDRAKIVTLPEAKAKGEVLGRQG
jgi:hypothetical protein